MIVSFRFYKYKPKLYHTHEQNARRNNICNARANNERKEWRKKTRNKLPIIIWIRNKCATIAYDILFFIHDSFICVHRWRTKKKHTLAQTLRIVFSSVLLLLLYFCLYNEMSLLCSTLPLSAGAKLWTNTENMYSNRTNSEKRQPITKIQKIRPIYWFSNAIISQSKDSFMFEVFVDFVFQIISASSSLHESDFMCDVNQSLQSFWIHFQLHTIYSLLFMFFHFICAENKWICFLGHKFQYQSTSSYKTRTRESRRKKSRNR